MTKLMRFAIVAMPLFAGFVIPASADESIGNVERGEDLALVQCAECHSVERILTDFTEKRGPSFANIAASDHSALSLSVFLRTPHDTMPNLVLTKSEIEDLIAYILSMKED